MSAQIKCWLSMAQRSLRSSKAQHTSNNTTGIIKKWLTTRILKDFSTKVILINEVPLYTNIVNTLLDIYCKHEENGGEETLLIIVWLFNRMIILLISQKVS